MRHCFFCQKNIKEIDYTNIELLKKYLTPLGKINSSRYTGTCAKHQRQLAKAIKRARNMGLLPFSRR
jgi:small subunit ribosomal protein S18